MLEDRNGCAQNDDSFKVDALRYVRESVIRQGVGRARINDSCNRRTFYSTKAAAPDLGNIKKIVETRNCDD